MSSFFNMDSPIMRFLSRVCDLIILNLLDYCLLYPGIYSRRLYHRTVFRYIKNGQRRGVLYRKRFL